MNSQLQSFVPLSVSKLTLNNVYRLESIIPASVTQLTLEGIDTQLDEEYIPPTVKHINIVDLMHSPDSKLLIRGIPKSISTRLNGQYFMYRSSNDQIPDNTTHLLWNCTKTINASDIPNSVHTLIICNDDRPIFSVPSSITQMVFHCTYRKHFKKYGLPPNLKYLHFNRQPVVPLDSDDFPDQLTHLTFREAPDYEVNSVPASVSHWSVPATVFPDLIPPNVKHIKLYDEIDMGYLSDPPPNIKSIQRKFPKSMMRSLPTKRPIPSREKFELVSPSTQIHLYIDDSFQLKRPLVENIKSITFESYMTQQLLPDLLPNCIGVESLDFGNKHSCYMWNNITKENLPASLKVLKLGIGFKQSFKNDIYNFSTELTMNCYDNLECYPPHLTKLVSVYDSQILSLLPNTITDLEFTMSLTHPWQLAFPIQLIPPNVTRLVLAKWISIESPDLIPATIKSLSMCPFFIPALIPTTVESLTLDPAQLNCLYSINYDSDNLLNDLK
ncbi:hypothetical protein CYY_008442 [Polysphondylium violaceum]|uniref:FNIP repeat-containing protein n=1 Tax=Polysphondylium violaceum TaxID=133409 RepID=A0A8J4UQ63_9MYCE|nr:hypothetical protein CYY_008442 [Polysphondylium violaceum]